MSGKMNFLLLLAFISSITADKLTGTVGGASSATVSPTLYESPRPDTMAMFGIPYEMFHCGSGEFITNQVIGGINRTCPAAAADLNHCCAVHDDCYGNRLGRHQCDEKFCECLAYYSKNTENAEPCGKLTSYACDMVKQYGVLIYDQGATAESPNVEQYVSKEMPRIENSYHKVYEKCTTQHVTLASCALNYDICHNNPIMEPKQACVLNFLRCVDDTKIDRNPNPECDMAVEELLWKLVTLVDQKAGSTGEMEGSGEMNVLMMQGVLKNQTFVRKIYLQIVRTTSSFSWIVYLCFFLCIFLCCIICIIGLTRNPDNDRRRHPDEVINVRVTSTPSSEVGGSRKSKTCSESEATSSKSSIKK